MKIIKILLLIILLSLIPNVGAEASIFISQTSSNDNLAITIGSNYGQNFTMVNYANASTYKLEYIEIRGQKTTPGSTTITMNVSNNTWVSSPVTISMTDTLANYRFNFSDTYLLKGQIYNFSMYDTSAAMTLRYSFVNPYPDGLLFIDGISQAVFDFYFIIGLTPHDNVGNYTFNQGTNVYANDSSGFNLNASKTAGSMGWSTNLINGSVNASSLNFDGSTYLSITNSTGFASEELNFSYITPYSIDVWVRTNNTPLTSSNVIVSKISSGTNGGYELNYSNGKIYWTIARTTDANSLVVNTSNAVMSSSWTWYHILATYNGSSSTAGATIYINGVSAPLQSLVNVAAGEPRNSIFLKIGAQSGTTNFINATMDELKIYNYALNVSEGNIVYQQYQPAGGYPTGNYTITPSGATQFVNFSWHDNLYSQDELIIATDSSFTAIIHDAFYSPDFANISLTSNTTYFWKVKQFNSSSGAYGNVSEVQKFTLGKFNGYLNILVLDEITFLKVNNYNATIYNGVVKSKSTINGVVNFTSSDIEPGEYQLVITVNSTYGERAIIVNSPGNYTVYVPSTTANTVDFVSFYLLDYTGRFSFSVSNLTITKGVNTTHSQYFDSDAKVAANLIRGEVYTITVYNPLTDDMQQWGSYSSTGTGGVQVVVMDLGVNQSILQPYVQQINASNASIDVSWHDLSNVLQWVNITVYKDNTSTPVYNLNTTIGTGTASYPITDLNATYITVVNASTTIGFKTDTKIFSAISQSTGLIKTWRYGSVTIPSWVKNAFAIIVMFMLAGSFGAMHRGEGAIITAFMGVFFWWYDILSLQGAAGALFGGFVLYAVLYHLESKRRQGIL